MHTDYSRFWPVNWRPQDAKLVNEDPAPNLPRIHADMGGKSNIHREIHLPLTNRVEMHR